MDKSGWILLALYLASGLLNALLAFKTAEQWEQFCEARPKLARGIKALRKVGLDLPGLVRLVLPALQRAIAARRAP